MTSLSYDALSQVATKTVCGAAMPTETTSNAYDKARDSYFNKGRLTSAIRTVPAGTLAPVNVARQFNYDAAGRETLETHTARRGLKHATASQRAWYKISGRPT